jgi:hypothetical protein
LVPHWANTFHSGPAWSIRPGRDEGAVPASKNEAASVDRRVRTFIREGMAPMLTQAGGATWRFDLARWGRLNVLRRCLLCASLSSERRGLTSARRCENTTTRDDPRGNPWVTARGTE